MHNNDVLHEISIQQYVMLKTMKLIKIHPLSVDYNKHYHDYGQQ